MPLHLILPKRLTRFSRAHTIISCAILHYARNSMDDDAHKALMVSEASLEAGASNGWKVKSCSDLTCVARASMVGHGGTQASVSPQSLDEWVHSLSSFISICSQSGIAYNYASKARLRITTLAIIVLLDFYHHHYHHPEIQKRITLSFKTLS